MLGSTYPYKNLSTSIWPYMILDFHSQILFIIWLLYRIELPTSLVNFSDSFTVYIIRADMTMGTETLSETLVKEWGKATPHNNPKIIDNIHFEEMFSLSFIFWFISINMVIFTVIFLKYCRRALKLKSRVWMRLFLSWTCC